MRARYSTRLFARVLVPVVHGSRANSAISCALSLADPECVLLAGIVGIPSEESLSAAAEPARHARRELRDMAASKRVKFLNRIRASHIPWEELVLIVQEEHPDLLIIETAQLRMLNVTAGEAFRHPPCDMVIAGGVIPPAPARILVSLRGGPSAELSLRLGLAISRISHAKLTALHISSPSSGPAGEAAFKGVDRVLKNLPEVERRHLETIDPTAAIREASRDCDLLIIGATVRSQNAPISIGPVAENILRDHSGGVLVAKSRRPLPLNMESEAVGQNAISILVDKWFAENTYQAVEFADLEHLLGHKKEQQLRISLAMPALNEEQTIGRVIKTIKDALFRGTPLVDEIVLVDSGSTDATREIAAGLEVPVHVHQEVLPQYGVRSGKGEALWKSLYLTTGDIVIWVDTDIANIHPRFVYGLVGPLILHPEVQFVKGFYRRPLRVGNKMQAGGGGRVTELTARPLLNLFFPELSGLVQPLSGEYGGRRNALEQMAFSSGYGVEIGLLIDVFERFGLGAIAQVDLEERIHHNQPLESLSKMSFAIIQTVIRRIEKRYGASLLEDVNKSMKLIRYGQQGLVLEVEEIAEVERPAMIEVPEYRERFKPAVMG
jgi:glycosyltransferase involved in cell wall biosynthesis/nucleotide-binding universal stress UspA family protein